MTWNQRYRAAYEAWQEKQYPASFRDFGYILPQYPAVSKANGLTQAIVKYLTWSGWRATRINTQGQMMTQKDRNGHITGHKFRPSTTRRGTADISATIRGRSCMIEVKAGADKPSEHQLAEQQRERAAGGVYEFIYNMDQFFQWYDSFMLSLTNGSPR